MSKTVNEVRPAYTYYLEPKLDKIYAMAFLNDATLEDMKRNIKHYVAPARSSYTKNGVKHVMKKVWFLNELDKLETKQEVFNLCNNSVNKARATLAR